MKNIKGNILIKIHNCIFCHRGYFLRRYYPKIENQYSDYLIWSLKQYQFNFKKNIFIRDNYLMKIQARNLSIFDIKNISLALSFE
ncbi:Cytochrome c553 [Candidatus Nasuia deltocephalinicola]|nr:Cytochrome c553 [Candidatus Nasuia deltocephalinicola]